MNAQLKDIPSFARESLGVLEQLKPFLESHYSEVGHYQDIGLDIDYAKYRAAERSNALRLYTIRTCDGLIGYEAFIVTPALWCSHCIQANHVGLYVTPRYRNGLLARNFIDWCDTQLRAEGVVIAYQSVKDKLDYGPILESLGYELIEHTYGRRLNG